MTARRTPDHKLIPPGINDERTRALLGAFMHAASQFDFSKLLMRTGSEIPDDMLELAVHDFSLSEFVGPDGVPAEAARRLIDNAWDLHEQQGTDAGVHLALSMLGCAGDITHWWQTDPEGPHDTHDIAVFFEDVLFTDSALGDEKYRTAGEYVIDTAKRWSQETALRFGVQTRAEFYLGVIDAQGGRYVAQLPADDLPPVPSISYAGANCLFGGTFTAQLEV